ncbi:MAG: magnesium protoporphyrin IX methyltransferase [Pseudomonadota bacterium]
MAISDDTLIEERRPSPSYRSRRRQIAEYFDATAAEAWQRLTSDAPVSKVRATVREGRARMADTLAGWMPEDLSGARILDAGCGTGMMAQRLAARGAEVVAVDLAESLVKVAAARAAEVLPEEQAARISFFAGDMLDAKLGRFDWIIAMDSLIHYRQHDLIETAERLATRSEQALLMTFAPRTRSLAMMHFAGQMFPRGDRSPAIEPIPAERLKARLSALGLTPGRSARVAAGFYISEALEVSAP